MKIIRLAVTLIGLVFLCSCATNKHILPQLPANVAMNPDAGRGDWLIINIHLKNGPALPFVIDTGAPFTIFDPSLESQLGKPVRTETIHNFGFKSSSSFYAAPDLYLGDVRLANAGHVATLDCSPFPHAPGNPIMGILGIDVLKHYCLQLDFTAKQIRFLDDTSADKSAWGHPFRLSLEGNQCFLHQVNLVGTKTSGSGIDTGCNYDGWLVPELFQQWTNRSAPLASGSVHSPNTVLGGIIYSNVGLSVPESPASSHPALNGNGIGLHFLSRNLVTFDFPAKTLYLKQITAGRMPFKNVFAGDTDTPLAFLYHLREQGRLPGWSKNEPGQLVEIFFGSVDFKKPGDPSIYHYSVTRPFKDGPWELQKAWRTDPSGHVLQEYPAP